MLLAQRGFDPSHFTTASTALPAEDSLTGLAAARGQTVTSSDIVSDPRIEPDTRARLVIAGFGEGASIPILNQGAVLGALNLIYKPGARLRPEERRLLEAMAGTIGVAMAQRRSADAQRRLEDQARRAQQLECLSALAGGIAHDFNNLLMGILGNVDVARRRASAAGLDRTVDVLDEALRAGGRAAALVQQLLSFARGGAPAKQVTAALADVVRDAAQFALRGASVRCEVSVEGETGSVEVDPGQVAQVVQNLVLNAAQASAPGATVIVRLDRRDLAEPEPPLAAGSWLRLRVIDRGHGIPAEALPRIFEPFFSARKGGTGLGLAVCHSIVRRHGGQITVESRPEQGTTVTVHLPAGSAEPSVAEPAKAEAVPRGGRALVMDDDPTVRAAIRRMLEGLGFQVAEAESGAQALAAAAAAQAADRPFDVALLDVTVVGGLGGGEVLGDVRRASPRTRLVLSTGYSAANALESLGAVEADGVLEKPYTSRQLAAALVLAGVVSRPGSDTRTDETSLSGSDAVRPQPGRRAAASGLTGRTRRL